MGSYSHQARIAHNAWLDPVGSFYLERRRIEDGSEEWRKTIVILELPKRRARMSRRGGVAASRRLQSTHRRATPSLFRRPKFNGPTECPGLPLNLEALIRQLEDAAGGKPLGWSWYRTIPRLVQIAKAVTNYWERGEGAQSPRNQQFNHNLAIWGWDVRD